MARALNQMRQEARALRDMKIGVVGLGLIGGSVAHALRAAGFTRLVAADPDVAATRQALADGVVTCASADYGVLSGCDVVFICAPVDRIAGCMAAAGRVCPDALFTDVASTKAYLVQSVRRDAFLRTLRYVPGHPMSGSEKTGYRHCDEHLFENAYYILCDDTADEKSLETVESLAAAMGAIPMRMKAREHDRLVAYVSHLPHIAASALVGLVSQADTDEGMLRRLAAGGFKDITRIASSDPALWRSILHSGRETALSALSDYIALLKSLRDKLSSERFDEVEAFLASARHYRDCLPQGKGALAADCELWVNIPDRVGIIGEVAMLLASESLSIVNINIQNSREYEGGVLRISFRNAADCRRAGKLLAEHGYDVPRRG